jgi:hemolysin-activating ACP:hemolysin acyltransferase
MARATADRDDVPGWDVPGPASMDRPGPRRRLRLIRPKSGALALGLAVSHLMTKPAFAALAFGSWSRVLVGQINRGHYHFVADEAGRVVGFLGWAVTSEQGAESWLAGRGIGQVAARDGDCMVINAWAADDAAVNHLLLATARRAGQDKRLVYFKRHYRDGRTRPMRLAVNDFVEGHLGRGVS